MRGCVKNWQGRTLTGTVFDSTYFSSQILLNCLGEKAHFFPTNKVNMGAGKQTTYFKLELS